MTRRGEEDEFPFDVCYVEISTIDLSLGMKLDIKVKKRIPTMERTNVCRIDLVLGKHVWTLREMGNMVESYVSGMIPSICLAHVSNFWLTEMQPLYPLYEHRFHNHTMGNNVEKVKRCICTSSKVSSRRGALYCTPVWKANGTPNRKSIGANTQGFRCSRRPMAAREAVVHCRDVVWCAFLNNASSNHPWI